MQHWQGASCLGKKKAEDHWDLPGQLGKHPQQLSVYGCVCWSLLLDDKCILPLQVRTHLCAYNCVRNAQAEYGCCYHVGLWHLTLRREDAVMCNISFCDPWRHIVRPGYAFCIYSYCFGELLGFVLSRLEIALEDFLEKQISVLQFLKVTVRESRNTSWAHVSTETERAYIFSSRVWIWILRMVKTPQLLQEVKVPPHVRGRNVGDRIPPTYSLPRSTRGSLCYLSCFCALSLMRDLAEVPLLTSVILGSLQLCVMRIYAAWARLILKTLLHSDIQALDLTSFSNLCWTPGCLIAAIALDSGFWIIQNKAITRFSFSR